MALRSRGVPTPPSVDNPSLEHWMQEVSAALNGLPLSYFSTTDGPNTSAVTAPRGFIGIEVGSSVTRVWIKTTNSGSTGWVGLGGSEDVRGDFSSGFDSGFAI